MTDHPSNDSALILRAALFAAHKHRDQRRKDDAASPYINHPLALASVLAVEGGITDAATLCAALLHDTVEDTETTGDEIEREFGAEVRYLVEHEWAQTADDVLWRRGKLGLKATAEERRALAAFMTALPAALQPIAVG